MYTSVNRYIISFEYHTTQIGSWDKKWSGSGKVFAKLKTISKEQKEKLEKMGFAIQKGKSHSFHYDFQDGWACNVTMTVGTKKEFQSIMRQSQGFLGYDWMIQDILENGQIDYRG